MVVAAQRMLPRLHVRDTGPGTPRKVQPQTAQGRPGRKTPDHILAEIMFLMDEVGMMPKGLAALYPGVSVSTFHNIRQGFYKDLTPKAPAWINVEEWNNRPQI